jgi:uncharacterized protein (TIGR00730 family)
MKKEDKKKINLPDAKIPKEPLRTSDLEKEAKRRGDKIEKEFRDAFTFIKNNPKSVTFFGSARFRPANKHYKEARSLAFRIADELKYAVVTGGGPGIMEAANRGAFEAGGASFGLNIKLPYEQVKNPYVTESVDFYYFFSRKVALSFSAEAYIFFPGGFGTLDEVFEILTLVQTQKIPRVPVVLFGSDYWQPINKLILKQLYNSHKAIDQKDMDLYVITDNEDEVLKIVKEAPLRD